MVKLALFEWMGAGSIDESKLYPTMDRVRGPIEKIYYGQDENKIYLAFEGEIDLLKTSNLVLEIYIEQMQTISFSMNDEYNENGVKFAIDERIELELSKNELRRL